MTDTTGTTLQLLAERYPDLAAVAETEPRLAAAAAIARIAADLPTPGPPRHHRSPTRNSPPRLNSSRPPTPAPSAPNCSSPPTPARGVPWPAVAQARGYTSAKPAQQRYNRLTERHPEITPPLTPRLHACIQHAGRLVAATGGDPEHGFWAAQAARVLAALLYAVATTGRGSGTARAWHQTGDYATPVRILTDHDAPDTARALALLTEHEHLAGEARTELDRIIADALTTEEGEHQ